MDTIAPFLTLAHMREEHTLLTMRYRADSGSPEVVDAAAAFLARGGATGRTLEGLRERASAQTMLDYWSTVLFRERGDASSAMLDEFESSDERQLADADCPYPGVRPFDASMRAVFHGRGPLVSELVALLDNQECICLVGEPGVGKTSLLNAGLLPALEDLRPETTSLSSDGSIARRKRRFFAPIIPGADPLGNLARALGSASANPTDALAELLDEAAPGGDVLVVDGLEELFTLCPDTSAREQFASALVQIAARRTHLLILTIRTPWMTDLAALPELYALVQRTSVAVSLLAGPDVLKAITAPAQRVGLTFDERLADAVANDFLNEPPALLQLALVALWQHRVGTRVQWRAYAELGRGRTYVCRQAEGLPLTGDRADVIRDVLLAFIEPGARTGQMRTRRVARATLQGLGDPTVVQEVLDLLVGRQLLRTSESNTPGDVRYEWLHDVLNDAVPAIGDWLHTRELEQLRAVAERERRRADEEERLRHEETRLKKKARKRAWAFAAAATIAFLLAIATLQQLSNREILLMASASERLASSDPDLAVALAARAIGRSDTNDAAVGAAYTAYFSSATQRVYTPADAGLQEGSQVSAVAAAGDTSFVVVGYDGGDVVAWNLDERRVLWRKRLDEDDGRVTKVAVDPRRETVMVGAQRGAIALYRGRDGVRIDRVMHTTREVRALAFNADGTMAASGSDRDVWVWKRTAAEKGEWSQLNKGDSRHASNVRGVAFSKDSRFVFSAEENDGAVIPWTLESSESVGRVATRPAPPPDPTRPAPPSVDLTSFAVSPNGCALLTGFQDGILGLVSVATAFPKLAAALPADCRTRMFDPVRVPAGAAEISSVAFGPDGNYAVSGSEDWTVALWRVGPLALDRLKTFRGHAGPVETVAFQSPTSFISGADDQSVRMWTLDAGLEVARLDPPALLKAGDQVPDVRQLAVAEDSAYAVFSLPNTARISEWRLGGATATLRVEAPDQQTATVDPGGTRALTQWRTGVAVHDLKSGRPLWESKPLSPLPLRAAIGGQTVAWISDGDFQLHVVDLSAASSAPDAEASQPKALGSLQPESSGARRLSFPIAVSADGRRIAVGTPTRRVLIFDAAAASGAPVSSERVHGADVTTVAFDTAGETVASASSDGTIVLWGLDGRERGRLRGHTTIVRALAFTRDGRFLLSGADGQDGLRVWHRASRRVVHVFEGQADVRALAVTPDDRYAVSGDATGTIKEWSLPAFEPGALLKSIGERRWVKPLTASQIDEFGLNKWLDFFHTGKLP